MQSALRMIDANANRAAEGLRVMEDVARFALDHAELAALCKGARHDLRSALEGVPGGRLGMLASRDTPGDVGTSIKAEGTETVRASLNAVAAAAAGRVMEGLRAIEETAKVVAPAAAGAVERVRYRVYEIDKRLGLALGTGRGAQWRLCVLITESLCKRPWLDVARGAIEGGADCLQLREKGLADGELLKRATALVELARGRAAVIVNDRADIALAAGADGVHLGQEDAPVSAVRALAGDRLLVGVSTHDLGEARRALRDGADYVGVGAMFPTATKAREASGVAYLRAFLEVTRETRPLPHLAIGGITAANIGQLVEAGCRGVAVSSTACGSDDPA
ncbi:MAG TPA: thiamine phosphate synthase, partial [Phycisphaerales bacterium]|nr:thiamine phosphate synthase [Phycisphaerales bacterium]